MARIYYSLAGEGRGHATRVRAIVDQLRDRHEITIFAPGDAWDLLEPAYRDSQVRVHRIPCLRFFYTPDGKLDIVGTARGNLSYLLGFSKLRRRLEKKIRDGKPDLVITDFEPALARAARRTGVPFVSLNHQHFLIVNDLSSLPKRLRRHAWAMSQVVRRYYSGQALTIVSSFYFPPLKSGYDGVVQVGVILRPSVIATPRTNEGHLVAYLRKFAPENALKALRECGRRVVIYGLGTKPNDGNIEYAEISETNFLRDLGSCDALVTTAGNQLVGEALYLGKPVLAMPEPNNQEQEINAFFLASEGTGQEARLADLTTAQLRDFLSKLDEYRSRIEMEKYNGTPLAIAAVENFISQLGSRE